MFRFFEKTKGSISIFLTIILLPMLLFSGMIVDASRIGLAKSMVASAGDLTMNAALANYDTVLKDVYGLFAMSQNGEGNLQENLENNLKKYFDNTLMESGIDPNADSATKKAIHDAISALLNDSNEPVESDNLMELAYQDTGFFKASNVADSSLADPDILKNEIVNYMKYRGPIDLGMSFLEALSAFSKMGQQTEIVDGKLDTDNALKDVNKACQGYFESLAEANAEISTFKNGYADMVEKTGDFVVDYKTVNDSLLLYLLEVERWDTDNPYYSVEGSDNSYGLKNLKTGAKIKDSGSNSDLDEAHNKLLDCMKIDESSAFKNMQSQLVAIKTINTLIEAREYFNKYKSEDYFDKILTLYKAWYDYNEAYDEAYEEYEDDLEDHEEKASENPDSDPGPAPEPPQYDDELLDRVDVVMHNACTVSDLVNINYDTCSSEVMFIVLDHSSYIGKKLENIILITDLVNKANSKADKVKESISVLNNKLEIWGNKIEAYDSSDTFKQTMKNEHENKQSTFQESEIDAITTRLNNNITFLESVKTQLEKFQYGSKKLKDIWSYDKVIEALGNHPLVNTQDEADTAFNTLFIEGNLPVNNVIVGGEDPSCFKTLEDDPELRFYKYLYANFHEAKLDDAQKKEQEQFNERANKQMDDLKVGMDTEIEKQSRIQHHTEDITKIPDLPSQPKQSDNNQVTSPTMGTGNGKDANDTSSFKEQSGIVATLFRNLKVAGLNTRDNLYVMDYATGMFSDNLAKKNTELLKDQNKQLLTLSNVSVDINNNYFYGAEVEYILFGRDTPKKNVDAAKSQIFAVRFMCNSIYALTDGEIRTITLPPAAAISAATGGIVPVFLVQGVIQLALALAESSWDMAKMMDAKRVAIFKSKQTWTMSPLGGANTIKTELKSVVSDKAKETAVVLATEANEAIQKLIDSTADNALSMTQEVTGALQNATQQKNEQAASLVISQYSETIISKVSRSIDEITKNANAGIDTLVDQAFDEANKSVLASIDKVKEENLVVYEAEKLIYDLIINNAEADLRKEVKDKLKLLVNDVKNAPYQVVQSLTKLVTDRVNGVLVAAKDQVDGLVEQQISTVKGELSKLAEQGTDKAKDKMIEVVNTHLEKLSGSPKPSMLDKTVNKKPSVMQTLLVFGYSDYLKLFLFLGLSGHSGDEEKRIADLIQINISKATDKSALQHKREKGFRMSDAFTYVGVEAKLGLKTMFMDIPFLTTYAKETAVSYLNVHYKSFMGY